MCHKAGPAVIAVLALGLILTLRRLSDAQTKLERIRGQADRAWANGAEAFAAQDASELAREWEEAVPPTDS